VGDKVTFKDSAAFKAARILHVSGETGILICICFDQSLDRMKNEMNGKIVYTTGKRNGTSLSIGISVVNFDEVCSMFIMHGFLD
jgi:hypothetical protein